MKEGSLHEHSWTSFVFNFNGIFKKKKKKKKNIRKNFFQVINKIKQKKL